MSECPKPLSEPEAWKSAIETEDHPFSLDTLHVSRYTIQMHFADRDLKRFYEKGDASGIRPDWVRKVRRLLDRLEAAGSPDDLGGPQMGFHALKGDRLGQFALTVSRNQRMTFRWRDGAAVEITLEDYHG